MSSARAPQLRTIVGATFVWKLGDGLIATALSYIALVATGSSFWVGVQYALSLATAAIAAACLGSWMDRQRLVTMVRVGAVSTLLAVGVVALSTETTDTVIAGMLIATPLVSISFVVLSVALGAAIAATVPPRRLLFGSTVSRSAQLMARALGGLILSVLLYSTTSVVIMLIAAALTGILWLVGERYFRNVQHTPNPTQLNGGSALRVFAQSVRRCAPQRLVLAMALCYGIFVAPFIALLPVLATELTGNSANVGWLSAAYFAGGAVSVVSGYVSTRIAIPLSARALMSCGLSGLWLVAIAVCMLTLSGTALAILGVAFTFLFGHASTMILSVFNVAAQDNSPEDQRRRVLSALIVIGSAVSTVAVLVAGWWSVDSNSATVFLLSGIALAVFALVQLAWHAAINRAPLPS